jgi:hypothetical protein
MPGWEGQPEQSDLRQEKEGQDQTRQEEHEEEGVSGGWVFRQDTQSMP